MHKNSGTVVDMTEVTQVTEVTEASRLTFTSSTLCLQAFLGYINASDGSITILCPWCTNASLALGGNQVLRHLHTSDHI